VVPDKVINLFDVLLLTYCVQVCWTMWLFWLEWQWMGRQWPEWYTSHTSTMRVKSPELNLVVPSGALSA